MPELGDAEKTLIANIPGRRDGRKLLLVLPGVPHPRDGASAVLFYWYALALKAAGYKILNVLLLDRDIPTEAFTEYRERIEDQDTFRIEALVWKRPIKGGLGGVDIDPRLQTALSTIARDFSPEYLVCFDLTSAWAASKCEAAKSIAWLGDLQFQTNWYHGLYGLHESRRYIWALTAMVRSHQWKRPYALALEDFSKVIVSSGSSVGQLARLGINAEYLPYPWPSEPPMKRALPDKPTLIYFGHFGALGSISSFRFLAEGLHGALERRLGAGNFLIRICGRGTLPTEVERTFAKHSEFDVLGFVPRLEPLLATSHALIAPVEAPVGNRSRILTAMAQQLPVIAHPNTVLGNPDLRDGDNCFLAVTAEDMADKFCMVFRNPELAERIARRGFDLYQTKFNPARACTMMLGCIASLQES